jgi:hypothetical protein
LESQDAEAADVNSHLDATITLRRPNNTIIVVTVPSFDAVDSFTAFDGILDHAGTSGTIYNPNTTDSDSTTSSSGADLALFTGLLNISLPVKAVAGSASSGSGNLDFHTSSLASARLDVYYNYNAVGVPEPATLGMFGSGLLIAAYFGRKRTRKN